MVETLFDLNRYQQSSLGDYSIDCRGDEYLEFLERARENQEKQEQKKHRNSANRTKLIKFLSTAWCETGQILKIGFGKNNVPLIVYLTRSGNKGCRFIKKAEFFDVLFAFLSEIGVLNKHNFEPVIRWKDLPTTKIRCEGRSGAKCLFLSITSSCHMSIKSFSDNGGDGSAFVTPHISWFYLPIDSLTTFWNLSVNFAAIALLPMAAIRNFIEPVPEPTPPAPTPPKPTRPAPTPPKPTPPARKHQKLEGRQMNLWEVKMNENEKESQAQRISSWKSSIKNLPENERNLVSQLHKEEENPKWKKGQKVKFRYLPEIEGVISTDWNSMNKLYRVEWNDNSQSVLPFYLLAEG